jgi:tRNA 2-thiouridine synthesizing protein A
MTDNERQGDERLDLCGVACPMNFVKTKLQLEMMEVSEVLEVILDDGEPMRSVPRSLKEEGHKIERVQKLDNGTYRLLVRRQ